MSFRKEHLWLYVGDKKIYARFEKGRSTEEKLSTVHYVRFQLEPEESAAFQRGTVPVKLEFDHPNYQAHTVLTNEVRSTLAKDLEDY